MRTLPLISSKEQAREYYRECLKQAYQLSSRHVTAVMRFLARSDLFFLLAYVLHRPDVDTPPMDTFYAGWCFDRCREVQMEPDGCMDLWGREHFKDLDVNTDILTTKGWKKHGDLGLGDWVFSNTGEPVEVIANHPFYDSKCYRVTFDNDISIIAGAGHYWNVEVPSKKRVPNTFKTGVSCGKRKTRESKILSTESILSLMENSEYRIGIKVADALDVPDKELPIDPYLLGVWLGDGFSAHATLCGIDGEIFDEVENRGYSFRPDHKDSGVRHPNWRVASVKGLQKELRALDLIKNKHIPEMYFTASKQQRTDLLCGLIDTDGNIASTRNATATFANSNYRLAQEVQTLAISLGYKARLTPSKTNNSYQVCFQVYAEDDVVPCLLPRKQSLLKSGIKRHRASKTWYINSIEPVDTIPTNCIEVASKEGMYLAGKQLIPTHNSTIITFALTIQDILREPEITVGVFSHKSKIAKDFAVQIKREFEDNSLLKALFPEICWKNPKTESPKWSDDEGFIVKRQGNPKEATVEPWGLVDGQPTGRHFQLMVFDDVVTRESVTNADMINKTNKAWSDALNLTTAGGRIRYIGTRWNYADTYQHILKKGTVKLRFHPGVDKDNKPVYWDEFTINKKRKEMGPKTFAAQILLDPKQAETVAFDKDWIQWWDAKDYRNMNVYAVWDPATTKGKKSDYTVSWVFGIGADENIYIITGIRRKWGLEERQVALFNQYKTYKPNVVGYESTGPNVDLEHFQLKMQEQHFHFQIKKLDDRVPKEDRIDVLRTKFIQKKIFLPERIIHTNDDNVTENLIEVFLEDEYFAYPNVAHDDMLDCLANIFRGQMQTAIRIPTFQGQDEKIFTPEADNSMDLWDDGDSAFY